MLLTLTRSKFPSSSRTFSPCAVFIFSLGLALSVAISKKGLLDFSFCTLCIAFLTWNKKPCCQHDQMNQSFYFEIYSHIFSPHCLVMLLPARGPQHELIAFPFITLSCGHYTPIILLHFLTPFVLRVVTCDFGASHKLFPNIKSALQRQEVFHSHEAVAE